MKKNYKKINNQNIFVNRISYKHIKFVLDIFFQEDGTVNPHNNQDQVEIELFLQYLQSEYINFSDNTKLTIEDITIPKDILNNRVTDVAYDIWDLLLRLEDMFRDAPLFYKRWYYNILCGVVWEEYIGAMNPNWEQITGEWDEKGKIDFIDWDNKIIYTLKATHNKHLLNETMLKVYKYCSNNEIKELDGFELVGLMWDPTNYKVTKVHGVPVTSKKPKDAFINMPGWFH